MDFFSLHINALCPKYFCQSKCKFWYGLGSPFGLIFDLENLLAESIWIRQSRLTRVCIICTVNEIMKIN